MAVVAYIATSAAAAETVSAVQGTMEIEQ